MNYNDHNLHLSYFLVNIILLNKFIMFNRKKIWILLRVAYNTTDFNIIFVLLNHEKIVAGN